MAPPKKLEPQGNAPTGGVDAETLGRIAELERNYEHATKTINFVADTNKFIIVVLFATFLVIVVAIGIAVITSIHTHIPGPST